MPGRPKGRKDYTLKALKGLDDEWKTTREIWEETKKSNPTIHWSTVKRLLDKMESMDLAENLKIGTSIAWRLKE